ncbi:hypothetical protein B0H14DRAFT_2625896 [Mycena olivaceomarginata]|nr:hypothetical protein B0H14DRAFT_2625896 [Mycena olivaceomarginata]
MLELLEAINTASLIKCRILRSERLRFNWTNYRAISNAIAGCAKCVKSIRTAVESWTEPQCSIAQLVVEAEHQRKVADDIGDTQFILAASQNTYLTLWQLHAISILPPRHIILFCDGEQPAIENKMPVENHWVLAVIGTNHERQMDLGSRLWIPVENHWVLAIINRNESRTSDGSRVAIVGTCVDCQTALTSVENKMPVENHWVLAVIGTNHEHQMDLGSPLWAPVWTVKRR